MAITSKLVKESQNYAERYIDGLFSSLDTQKFKDLVNDEEIKDLLISIATDSYRYGILSCFKKRTKNENNK